MVDGFGVVKTSRIIGPDEVTVMTVRPHPIRIVPVVAGAFLVALCALAIGYVSGPDTGSDLIDTIVGGVVVIAVIRAGLRVLAWWAERIVLTTNRILEVSGWFTRSVRSIPLSRVAQVVFERGVVGRALGYGDVTVSGGGGGVVGELKHLREPERFYRALTVLTTPGPASSRPAVPVRRPDEEDTGPIPQVII
ncbi:MAG TPA: PH domain-containing protein [Actinomycetota bacterium]|nr:PH domain-containing protein [Actinomycetota bacterium]